MARFAFLSPPLAGHLSPMMALARELGSRGHRSTFLCTPEALPHLAPDIEVRPLAAGATQSAPEIAGPVSRLTGMIGVRSVIARVAAMTDALCREGPPALAAVGPDAIICDQLEPAGGLLAARFGLPLVSVANALPINREPGLPPPFTGWSYAAGPRAIRRNAGGYRIADWLMRPVGRVLERWSEAWGLEPRRRLEDCLGPVQISQMVEGLDFPRRQSDPVLHYTGPLREDDDPRLPEDLDAALQGRAGRPVVYASFGTLQGWRFEVFRRLAKACAAIEATLVVAHGGRLAPAQAGRLEGAIVRDMVPQRAVIRRASLVVTHGGMNTVLDSLAAGVPLLVLPMSLEQGAIGARVAASGAGDVLKRGSLGRAVLGRSVRRILLDTGTRARAVALSRDIAAAGGCRRAADIVEASLLRGAHARA